MSPMHVVSPCIARDQPHGRCIETANLIFAIAMIDTQVRVARELSTGCDAVLRGYAEDGEVQLFERKGGGWGVLDA